MINYKSLILDADIEDVEDHIEELADSLTDPMTVTLLEWYFDDIRRVDWISEAIQRLSPRNGWEALAWGQFLYHEDNLYEALEELKESGELATA